MVMETVPRSYQGAPDIKKSVRSPSNGTPTIAAGTECGRHDPNC
jgi:hypothetical protein